MRPGSSSSYAIRPFSPGNVAPAGAGSPMATSVDAIARPIRPHGIRLAADTQTSGDQVARGLVLVAGGERVEPGREELDADVVGGAVLNNQTESVHPGQTRDRGGTQGLDVRSVDDQPREGRALDLELLPTGQRHRSRRRRGGRVPVADRDGDRRSAHTVVTGRQLLLPLGRGATGEEGPVPIERTGIGVVDSEG